MMMPNKEVLGFGLWRRALNASVQSESAAVLGAVTDPARAVVREAEGDGGRRHRESPVDGRNASLALLRVDVRNSSAVSKLEAFFKVNGLCSEFNNFDGVDNVSLRRQTRDFRTRGPSSCPARSKKSKVITDTYSFSNTAARHCDSYDHRSKPIRSTAPLGTMCGTRTSMQPDSLILWRATVPGRPSENHQHAAGPAQFALPLIF
jgi:hypothetical protein